MPSELERVLNMKTQDDVSDRIDVMRQYQAVFHPHENRSWMCTVHMMLATPCPGPLPSPSILPESVKISERCAERCRTHYLYPDDL